MIFLWFTTVLVGVLIGYSACYINKDSTLNDLLETERANFKKSLDESNAIYKSIEQNLRICFETSLQERIKQHIKMLDEISQVTGIDEVVLPSFGKVRLNHSKNVREAMQAYYKEDVREDTDVESKDT